MALHQFDACEVVIDVVIGTLLHRMGMTRESLSPPDVDALVAMILHELG